MFMLLEAESVAAGRPNWIGLMAMFGHDDNRVDTGGKLGVDVVIATFGVEVIEV